MKLRRSFSPLDKWIYLKIYINPVASNIVLNNYLSPVLLSIDRKACKNWFFLRYSDPEYHIRLRLYVPLVKNRRKILSILGMNLNQGMTDGFIHSWKLDCYVREIERYGETNMMTSEQIFCCDSINSISIVANNNISLDILNQCSLALIYDTLDSLHFSIEEKISFCENSKVAYAKEMGISDKSNKAMNYQYQKYRNFLESLENKTWSGIFSDRLKERSSCLKSILKSNGAENNKNLNVHALLHLGINRMYESNARQYELILYHIMMKHYQSLKFRRDSLSIKSKEIQLS